MTKQIYSKALATAILLGAAATGAHAQTPFTTTGTYVPSGTDQETPTPKAVIPAGANSETLAVFQTNVASAFAAGTGGDITFDDTTFTAAPSFNASYGTTQGNTLTVTDALLAGSTGTYGPGTDATNSTSGSNYIGFANDSNNNFNFTFSQNLSDFGIMVINRFGERDLTFTVKLSDGSTVTPNAAPVQTSGTSAGGAFAPVFFEYAPTGGKTITSVNFSSTGLARFDDLGFITAVAPASAPEPSQSAAFAIGILGVGMLALRARKRSLLA